MRYGRNDAPAPPPASTSKNDDDNGNDNDMLHGNADENDYAHHEYTILVMLCAFQLTVS